MKDLTGRAQEAQALAEFLEHYGWIVCDYQLGCSLSEENGKVTLSLRAVYDPEQACDIT